MLRINCSGSPYEIGFEHGKQAKEQVAGSIAFYKDLFQRTASFEWPRAQAFAEDFKGRIGAKWPHYLEEMQGLADGSNNNLLDIIALNVRTEITFGSFTDPPPATIDGCTALSWQTARTSLLGQNWDWNLAQKPNLIILDIVQHNKPRALFVTEAGIIGKIGFNDAGVGVTLNAIRALGLDSTKLPVHLALRAVLDSVSVDAAVAALTEYGVASSCHITIADSSTSIGAECSAKDIRFLKRDSRQRLFHTNHFLEEHAGVTDSRFLKDSSPRLARIEKLCDSINESDASATRLAEFLKDDEGAPCSINRMQVGGSDIATLFSIVMDLTGRKANVAVGRPSEADEHLVLAF